MISAKIGILKMDPSDPCLLVFISLCNPFLLNVDEAYWLTFNKVKYEMSPLRLVYRKIVASDLGLSLTLLLGYSTESQFPVSWIMDRSIWQGADWYI